MKTLELLKPLFFPCAEILLFTGGLLLLDMTVAGAGCLFFLAACALNFSVHISFHEWIHHGPRSNSTISDCITILAGLPLNGYRLHHYNHHEYDNGPGDLSSTWDYSTTPPSARNVLLYSLLWPVQMYKARVELRALVSRDGTYAALRAPIRHEKWILLLWYVLLVTLAGWKAVVSYFAVTYIGWALASLHNYGQHMPSANDPQSATSYVSNLYNRIFCNNGLHHEHHARPGIAWHGLSVDSGARRITYPHSLAPLIMDRPERTIAQDERDMKHVEER